MIVTNEGFSERKEVLHGEKGKGIPFFRRGIRSSTTIPLSRRFDSFVLKGRRPYPYCLSSIIGALMSLGFLPHSLTSRTGPKVLVSVQSSWHKQDRNLKTVLHVRRRKGETKMRTWRKASIFTSPNLSPIAFVPFFSSHPSPRTLSDSHDHGGV